MTQNRTFGAILKSMEIKKNKKLQKKKLNISDTLKLIKTRKNFEDVIAALKTGNIPTQKIITQTVTLQEAPQALDIWDKNGAHITKIHVQLDSSD